MAYEEMTPEQLLETMLDSMDSAIDKREGSVAHDLVFPAAIEIANNYVELDSVLGLGFAETTEGIFLDMRASEFGVVRKPAVKAQGVVELRGPEDLPIPAGTRVQTDSEIFFVTLEDDVLPAAVMVEAEVGGIDGNVAAGDITSLAPGDLYGIVTVYNEFNFDGGSDEEDDLSLLTRLKDRVQKPVTSGNANHYRQWALEVAGIGDAKVYPVWNGGGTVKVVLLDTEKTAPSASVITQVRDYIETNRPIGATVTVVGASELAIGVTATLTLKAGSSLANVTAQFNEGLTEYLKSVAFTGEAIRYTRIANLVLDVPEVIDYTNLKVNGGIVNITPTADQVGITGVVTFT
ncbi:MULTISPECIES: baseplate J/gp47 family protein [Peribacillus]|uniref:baseplate J/gp47 family protein n=1 Tax=Peribacillus TaxID=2675229 RepID=UPI001F4DFC07|nr:MULTISPECIES: baseplate J/gp47 family protein [unclassified Peribacillus]MCK1985160.1 baseplate J/gp47 family protein [Peribacillus sp. Aquil_B1]MCK2007190.1 baseplate J/gp47 family protein [Peribacillus sp. Aquil_B8]